ncbi:universal stress protein [uncultured Aquimarina sp.]|uniref:universal stress protein n=1 Tax=uncultured Aquimarina sp. TaxID=575652 RepID=UPI003459D621
MIKNILVPTDFSSQAESALKVAAQLAKKKQCKNIPITYSRNASTSCRPNVFWKLSSCTRSCLFHEANS